MYIYRCISDLEDSIRMQEKIVKVDTLIKGVPGFSAKDIFKKKGKPSQGLNQVTIQIGSDNEEHFLVCMSMLEFSELVQTVIDSATDRGSVS